MKTYTITLMFLALCQLLFSQSLDINKVTELANNGSANDQCTLGILYRSGLGVLVDKNKAVYWFKKSADQGVLTAQSALADMYYDGEGIDSNKLLAVYYYVLSAEQGYAKSQYMAGVMLCKGEGVESPNMVRGAYWIKEAYNNDDEDIKRKAEWFWEQNELWKY